MALLDFLEPEEAVGNLWHDLATSMMAGARFEAAAVPFEAIRPSAALLFRALGGAASVDIGPASAGTLTHRRNWRRKLAAGPEAAPVASYDGERLRLPPVMDAFPTEDLNRAAYLWLTASAALTDVAALDLPEGAQANDCAQIRASAAACDAVFRACPGLRAPYGTLAAACLVQRESLARTPAEAAMEQALRDQLGGSTAQFPPAPARSYTPFAPVPIWLRYLRPETSASSREEEQEASAPMPALPVESRKQGERRDLDQANRRDSFIIHRFETILSWVESMNINRSVQDENEDDAQKAAEDQESVTLSKHDRKAATRLRLHLDLSPQEADHARLAGAHTYPEWNMRKCAYMEDHARVLEAPVQIAPDAAPFRPDPRRLAAVRRQFEALRPRRVLSPRQIDGQELDLDAVINARADLLATGRGSDRIYMASRKIERELSVAILLDCSRSTEASLGETSVMEVAREALAALAGGIDAAGDRCGIWGFSSLRRDRVFLHRVKGFADPMDAQVMRNIGGLKPGQYTRLGAALRHASTRLAEEGSRRKLLLVITDGKPNDLDHYEGQHGIEDSRMAVREARRAGQIVHSVIVDADGQDWFARIFGKGGFTLLPEPARLLRALPEIYRSLTQES
ncbi:nitric oxide reductase activation protein NorD [Pseudoruegeria sp. SHC-113]|uniref:nitric oxide reductase activation protein NorD n=1 Tax=Pseudoruegeria sp. SHC-113 TaxID=2855439 RepID=UPI0021BB3902|nr:VWA domain-containing protein [Pseudoruegeria sp. SHC-113]MCT8160158.1 VWA domain-containing protein [Pseudoruegeria sp. SHC-113]